MPTKTKAQPGTFRTLRRDPRADGGWRCVVLDALIERVGTCRCYLCGEARARSEVEIDHVVPLSKGGLHEFSNLAVACKDCNQEKHTRMVFFDVLVRKPVFFDSPVWVPLPVAV